MLNTVQSLAEKSQHGKVERDWQILPYKEVRQMMVSNVLKHIIITTLFGTPGMPETG